jgi:hypothetical protein
VRAISVCALLALSACAQSNSLERKLQAVSPTGQPNTPVWALVEVPIVTGHGTVCNHWYGDNNTISTRRDKIVLDGPRKLRLLFRVNSGKIEKISSATEDCAIDAGTQRIETIPNVTPEEVVNYLATRDDDSHLFALSLIDHPSATPKLIALAKDSTNPKRQKKAFFWLARSKNPDALAYIDRILR